VELEQGPEKGDERATQSASSLKKKSRDRPAKGKKGKNYSLEVKKKEEKPLSGFFLSRPRLSEKPGCFTKISTKEMSRGKILTWGTRKKKNKKKPWGALPWCKNWGGGGGAST